jgi:acyl-CoA synthetase (AMP-forming)/AMP-acid ligase II
MLGYWRRPEETRSAHRYGLLWTGDLGYLTDGGQLYVTARKSDVIVRGGAKVYPAEIERVLNACPGVAGSLVLGLPDERLGERIVAAVEFGDRVAPSHEQLREACRLSLARFKVPEEFLVLSCLPRNAMGKVNKRDVLGLLEDEIRSRTYG